jgi:hypothetical protein
MSEGSISIEFGGDNAKAIRMIAELENANKVLSKTLKDVQADATKAGSQQEQASKKAAEAVEKLRERNRQLEERLKSVEQAAKGLTDDYQKMGREQTRLMRANDALIRQNEKLSAGMDEVGNSATATGRKGQTAMEMVATGAKNAAAFLLGASGIAGAIGIVSKSLEDLEARAASAKQAALTVEEAEASIANNMASTGNPQADAAAAADLVQRGRQIAAERQVPVEMVQSAIAAGLSASGGDAAATLEAVNMQAELNRANPADMVAGVEGQVNVARIMGTQNAAAAQGVLELIGQNSAIKDPSRIAQNATPVLATADAFGMDINEVGAFFSTLTQQTADPFGESSRTTTISFLEQLSSFFGDGQGKALNDSAIAQRGQGLGFGEMVATLQSDQQLREKFQGGLSLEARSVGPIKALLEDSGGSFSETMFGAIAAAPTDEAGLAALVESRRAKLSAVPSIAVGDAERGMAAIAEQQKLADTDMQVSGVFDSKNLKEILASAGVSWDQRFAAGLQFNKRKFIDGESPEDAFVNTIDNIAKNIASDERISGRASSVDDNLVGVLRELVTLQRQAVDQLKSINSSNAGGVSGKGIGAGDAGANGMEISSVRKPIRNP